MSSNEEGDAPPNTATQHKSGGRSVVVLSILLVLVATILGGAAASWLSASPSASVHLTGASAAASRAAGDATTASLLAAAAAPPANPVPSAPGSEVPAGLHESDPFLTIADGRYLLTSSGGAGDSAINVPVVTSTDFIHWTAPIDALPTLPAWAARGFTWAPDIHRFANSYALYFTAQVKGSNPTMQCIGSAFGTSATGPYTARPDPFICQLDQGGSIDPRVFVDSDGTPWVMFKSDQNIEGSPTPTKMWSQRLSADGTRLLGSPSFLMSPDRPWQGTIVEAPQMVKVDGTYWVVYSANWYNNPRYGIGIARCNGPAGPCADESSVPFMGSNAQGPGPGEASVFQTASGIWMLYTPRCSAAPYADVPPRPIYITRLGWTAQGPYLASGNPPSAPDLLSVPFWAPTN